MRFLFFLFSLFFSLQVWSQEYLPAEHIGTQDGLSFRHVNHVYQDREGFMWFCTTDGLNRYDGVDWVIYKHIEGDSTSIADNKGQWIFEDKEGHLIVATNQINQTRNYSLLDKKKGKFRKIIFKNINEEKEEPIINQCITTKSGQILAIGGLRIIDKNKPSRGHWKYKSCLFNYLGNGVFELKKEIIIIEKPFAQTASSTTSEKYWFKNGSSYDVFNVDSNTVTRYNFTDLDDFHTSLPIDKKSRFWYPNIKSNGENLFDYFQLPTNIPVENWWYFRIDNYWNIWLIEKNRKIYRFDRERKYLNDKDDYDLKYGVGKKIFQDNDGTSWMPSKFGIDKIRKKRRYFENYLVSNVKNRSAKGIEIYPIMEGNDGKIHAMSGYNRMYTIDPKEIDHTTKYKLIGYENGKRKAKLLASELSTLPAPNSKIWFRSGQRIYLYDPLTDELINYPLPAGMPKFQAIGRGNRAYDLEMDDKGNLWFTIVDRLFSFDTLSKTFHADYEDTFLKGVVGIGEGRMWVCSTTRLSKFDENNQVIKEYDIPDASIPSNHIDIFIVVPYRDKVWIGTRTGLLEFDPKTEQFKRYTTAEGLSNNIIYTIISDGDFLWMGTHYGLCRFNIINGDVRNYYEHDGLSHNEFNREAAYKSKDGTLYFGGMNGINAFDPTVLDSVAKLEPSKLAWTHFSKIDRKLNTLQFRPTYQMDPSQPVEIFYGDRSFTFHYALLNYLEPSKNTYYYYLEGFELDWKYAENTAFTNYPILPPGEYVFRVKAKDALGNPGENELAIPVVVYGPWWSTWWAKSLFIFLALASVFAYIRWQTISLKRQKTVLEKTVKDRTVELNAQKERAERSEKFKEQFLANMSHEIRTPMHAISGMTNILLRNRTFKHQQKFLKAIQQNSGNLLVILNDILDLSKIEAGKIEIESIPVKPVIVIENVVEIMKIKAEEKGLTLQSSIDQNIPEYIYGDPTRLSQILLNLIGNAIKFTEKGGVQLNVLPVNEKIRFEVKDSGIGIPDDKLESVFGKFNQANESITRKYGGTGLGLNITKELVELQKGTIWVESEENVGSTFFFDLPLVSVETNKILEKQITEEQLQEMGAALSGLNILLVEDNDFNIMVATDDLSYYIPDVNIGFAKNGNLAIQEFENGNFDLILMDIQMPELSGYDATKAIRKLEKEDAHIPIIAMTASLLKSEIALCYEAGMDSYIPKPYQVEELIGTIYNEIKKPKL
ncbi:MAG: ATP-binding protein [Saprospiraceae bacterium]|jgi:signal transduction histidine kinase/CheY-like chemotaxis protein/streptogramin lyase|nr:ATP-binding protein [Saprospiraceae bacterium]